MSESCLVIHPATRNEGMRRESGMGITARDAVGKVGALRAPERISHNSSVSRKQSNPSKQVTYDSERKDLKVKTKPLNPDTSMREAGEKSGASVPKQKRKIGALQRSGPEMEEKESSEHATSGSCSERNPSLPQHERIQSVEPMDISYSCTPASLKLKLVLASRLSEVAPGGRIQVIDLSRRGLGEEDSRLIGLALKKNPQLAVLKLSDNNLGDRGASIIAASCSSNGRHHQGLTVLDLGFNGIGDDGCTGLSLNLLAGNHTLKNLYLSGNNFKHKGAMAIAGAILHGCSLSRLHLSANKVGPMGMKVLAGALAEMDARRTHLLQRQGGIVIASVKPPAIEELHLSDTSLTSQGFVHLSSMLVSNASMQTLSLSNNGIGDREMALLSRALAQNKNIPLASIHLSFNKITCTGVESFMNSVWGSQTLKEVKLDNNKMQDRGAQLCSVVLGSIRLEVLDISFNRVSTVGVKAMMKSLSENETLRALSLSGIPMDQNASKAVSYALAYNGSLETFNIDSCCVGYSGQRHIIAGVVSNRKVKLRKLTGFPLGPITKTLGLPMVPEDWPNDRILSFVRYMWSYWRETTPNENPQKESRGPSPPSTVAASAKRAFSQLSASNAAKMQFQREHALQTEESPMIAPDAAILVRSNSGQNLQIPPWGDVLEGGEEEDDHDNDNDSWSSDTDSLDRSSYSGSSSSSLNKAHEINAERRNKNLQWLRAHFQSLNEVGNLVFNNADLWQLHQYFFSPAYSTADESEDDSSGQEDKKEDLAKATPGKSTVAPPSTPVVSETDKQGNIGRSISFQTLGKAVAAAADGVDASRPNKRSSLDEALKDAEPCAKRSKNLKPRIAYFPRIREKLESLGTKPSVQTLALLRQLKYIESVILEGKNVYCDEQEEESKECPNASDVEMILLDLL